MNSFLFENQIDNSVNIIQNKSEQRFKRDVLLTEFIKSQKENRTRKTKSEINYRQDNYNLPFFIDKTKKHVKLKMKNNEQQQKYLEIIEHL